MSYQDLLAEQTRGRLAQEQINRLRVVGEIREAIIAEADVAHARYPQYRGHWAGTEWQLGFVHRTIRTKMGEAFRVGDVVLYHKRRYEDAPELDEYVTAYSVRNGIDTSLPRNAFEPLATQTTYRHPDGLVTFTS